MIKPASQSGRVGGTTRFTHSVDLPRGSNRSQRRSASPGRLQGHLLVEHGGAGRREHAADNHVVLLAADVAANDGHGALPSHLPGPPLRLARLAALRWSGSGRRRRADGRALRHRPRPRHADSTRRSRAAASPRSRPEARPAPEGPRASRPIALRGCSCRRSSVRLPAGTRALAARPVPPRPGGWPRWSTVGPRSRPEVPSRAQRPATPLAPGGSGPHSVLGVRASSSTSPTALRAPAAIRGRV